MEREKIRMPAGALIACILVVVFLCACLAGIAILINGVAGVNDPVVNNTQEPATPAPSFTVAPTLHVNNTATPSQNLIQGGTLAEDEDSLTNVIAKCMNAVVSIDITMQTGYTSVLAGSGSGVIITPNGYIATCNHVIEGASTISVYLNDGSEYSATLVGADSLTDIAIIKIEGNNFPYATLGSSESLMVGEYVFAIGNALGELSNTVTNGIISGLEREINVEGQAMTVLQTNAAINSGNSGGGLFLENGTLIGIVNAKSSGLSGSGSTIEGLGFAIPMAIAKPVMSDLMDYGFVTGRPFLGVSTQDVTYGGGFFNYYTFPSVVSIVEGSPAAIGGLQVNDVITAIDGVEISSGTELRLQINAHSVGDTITVTVRRGNSTEDLQITLLERTAQ